MPYLLIYFPGELIREEERRTLTNYFLTGKINEEPGSKKQKMQYLKHFDKYSQFQESK